MRIDGSARPLTMPTRLLPILFLMFGVQSSTSRLIMRVASLPHLKTPEGPSCSSRRLPLAMTLEPGSMSSIPGYISTISPLYLPPVLGILGQGAHAHGGTSPKPKPKPNHKPFS